MNKIKYIIYAAFMCAAVASCNLLDVENPSAIYGSGYWKEKGEVDSYLTGTYTTFRSCCNSLEYFEARGDSFIGGLEGSGSNQWNQNLTSLNGLSWGDYYNVIQHCNMIIKNIEKVTYSQQSEKNEVLAQAYAMRAYTYFSIVRLWGDCPLELVPTEGSEKEKLSRAPKKDVMEQILRDCDTAIELFPSDSWKNKSLASKRGTYALKADALLWKAKVLGGGEAEYSDVIKYADLAAEGSSLEPDFANIYGTKNGPEIIWSIHFGYPEIQDQYGKFMTLRDQFVKTAVNMDQIPYAISGARSSYQPSPEARAILGRYKGDVRESNAYIEAVDASGAVLGVSQNKMIGTKTETNRIFDSDIVLYRHAEMIMFKAEAYAAMGKTDLAIAELNKVRNRAKIGDYAGATDKTTVEKEILEERAREFWLENKRWPDLLRFHYEGVIDVYEVVPKLKERKEVDRIVPLYFAIPTQEISLNHNLKQTEGYDEN